MSLTLKRYPVGGLSQIIHDKDDGTCYQVSGPMGRQINVDLNGLNVIFAAGTGVLPFMDLLGFIARSILNLEVDKEQLGPNFRLEFDAKLGASEPIGHELADALASHQDAARYFKYVTNL